ncbi:alpha/beta hydrolase [Thiorhodococcus minor]|uniref:Alpha/beta fold hydrolase n=1 Tax=Thiorhodococcus minor TaxID=57489 RepID=A0A6M0K217_9GAMM|nr:alpha/beta fold hydrolase [Thiorhodococcus minor]NEV62627.1 alpha/beta fold hydrolase [Thiorhodococcus minor]
MTAPEEVSQPPPGERLSRRKRLYYYLMTALPLYVGVAALYVLLFTDVPEDPSSAPMHLLKVLGFLVALGVTIRLGLLTYGLAKINNPQGGFGSIRDTNTIPDCQPLSYSAHQKKPHVVVLLHGFTSSPMIFDHLAKELRENGIDFHAPLIEGFGLIRHDLLFTLREEDWVRQVTELYDLLSSQYEEISVIGHSLGGLLAVYLSQLRPVKHLVVAAPAIFPDPTQRLYRRLAHSQVGARIIAWTIPFLPKLKRKGRSTPNDVLSDEAAAKYFQYPVAPVRGVFNILKLQARVDFTQARFETLDMLLGSQDLTVDGNKILEHVRGLGIPHRVHKFDDTAHNPFVDNESELAGWIVIYILNGDLEWPPKSYVKPSQTQMPPKTQAA